MKGWKMYTEIHQLKNMGLNKSQVARHLGINVKTVNKYWNVDADGFFKMKQQSKKRAKKLDRYAETVLGWLQQFPDLSAAEVVDWLREHYPNDTFRERTVRRLAARLRKEYHIEKKPTERQYQAVVDPPMGKQLQVDFGEKLVRKASGGYIKIYLMGAVLSHSRYKYGEWSKKPFTTTTFIQALGHCFEYMDGVPEKIVLDQDKLAITNENYGDIIYTYEFEKFQQVMGFQVIACRKSDPESKGRIEAVIKYMKSNFAGHRLFINIELWNRDFEDWLDRTANRNIHSITKKVPAEVFLMEQQYLQPVPQIKTITADSLTVTVRKDNTVFYKGNRYTVPLGTYRPDRELEVRTENNILTLIDQETGEIMAQHKISLGKGVLVRNNHHLRDNSQKIAELYKKTLALLGGSPRVAAFLKAVHREKPRYVRDQFELLRKLTQKYPVHIIVQAINYCLDMEIYSAVGCRDTIAYLLREQDALSETSVLLQQEQEALATYLTVKTEHRSITVYTDLLGGGDR